MGKERSGGDKRKDKGVPSPHLDEYYDDARLKEEGWEATLTDEQKEIEAKKQKKREKAALKGAKTQNQKSDARRREQWNAYNVSKRLDEFVYNATTEHTGPVDSTGASLAAPTATAKVGTGTGKTKTSDRWKEWGAYQREHDHCVEWRDDAEKDGGPGWKLQRDKALYCTLTTPMEQYSSLLIKCRLCRNAQRKPILFDSEHAKSDKHLTAVAERTKAVNILKSIFATNLRCEITNQHLTRDPIPGHPCFVLIIKFDEVYKVANIPWVRCLLCGDQHDIDRSADDWMEQVERHKQTKRHVKNAWCLDEQYVREAGWKQEREKLMQDRLTFFDDPVDKNFYSWKTYEEHLLEDGGMDDWEDLDEDEDEDSIRSPSLVLVGASAASSSGANIIVGEPRNPPASASLVVEEDEETRHETEQSSGVAAETEQWSGAAGWSEADWKNSAEADWWGSSAGNAAVGGATSAGNDWERGAGNNVDWSATSSTGGNNWEAGTASATGVGAWGATAAGGHDEWEGNDWGSANWADWNAGEWEKEARDTVHELPKWNQPQSKKMSNSNLKVKQQPAPAKQPATVGPAELRALNAAIGGRNTDGKTGDSTTNLLDQPSMTEHDVIQNLEHEHSEAPARPKIRPPTLRQPNTAIRLSPDPRGRQMDHLTADSSAPAPVKPRPPSPAASSFWCGASGVGVDEVATYSNFRGRYVARKRQGNVDSDSDDSD